MIRLPRRRFLAASAALLAAARVGRAQDRSPLRRVGVLMPSTAAGTANLTGALERGLREQGYVQGNNLALEYRYTGGRNEQVGGLAAELVRAGAEVIVTTTDSVVGAVARKIGAIPIVMVNTSDPVGSGLVRSLARPGGNVTGLTNLSPEISGKRVELLKECVPALARLAYLWNPQIAGAGDAYREIETAATRLSLQLLPVEVRRGEEIESGISRLVSRDAALLVQAPNPLLYTQRSLICRLANDKRLPSMFNRAEYLSAGGFMSYGPDVPQMYRRAAVYVDKILKGARPAELPVEQPSEFELAINLRTARLLAIRVPESLLGRADRVIG